MALDRQSPPLRTKGGAPSRFDELRCNKGTQDPGTEEFSVVSFQLPVSERKTQENSPFESQGKQE